MLIAEKITDLKENIGAHTYRYSAIVVFISDYFASGKIVRACSQI
jgi:hypothetical protein